MSQCDSAIEGLVSHGVIQSLGVSVTGCDSAIEGLVSHRVIQP